MNRLLHHSAGLCLVALAAVVLLPVPASGEMAATMDLSYTKSNTSTEDTAGTTNTSRTTDFLQRYILGLRRDLYPTLSVGVGYVLEKDVANTNTDGIDSRSTLIRASPSADIIYKNPYVFANMNYSEMQVTTQASGTPEEKMLQEVLSASVGLVKQVSLPTLSLMYNRTHAYDRDHLQTDTISEQYTLSSRYQPVKQIEMRYTGTYSETRDKLHGVDTTSLLNTARLDYNDAFLRNRVRVNASYTVSQSQSQTRSVGSGTEEVAEAILPFAGLTGSGSLGTDTSLEDPTLDTMVSNSLLIDGVTNVASGINIGYSTLVTGPRNMGLDLGTETELNSIYVWVNQVLTESVANSFSWDIYVSSDTSDLKQWTLLQTVASAPFGVFDARFEVRFSNVKTRFIKVVTRPLASPVPVTGVDVNNILVTELQAFIFKQVQELSTSKTTYNSQRIDLGMNVKLANVPNLYYDLSFTQSKSDQSDLSPYTLLNRLYFSHRISKIFATGATTSRQDSTEGNSKRVSYLYSAFLTVTPLNTLNHNLRVSRSTDELNDERSSSNSVYFATNAAIYRGFDLSLAISQTTGLQSTGQLTRSTTITGGSTLIPYRTLTINLYYSDVKSMTTGTDSQDPGNGSTTRSGSASVSYAPFPTLFLYASSTTSETTYDDGKSALSSRTQSYSLSWSPAFAGALSFNFTATQVVTSEDHGESNTLTPSLRWQVNQYAFLDAGYQLATTKNISLRSRTESIFSTLRVAF